MTLQEAISQSTDELWFRPASWVGTGMAYRLSPDGVTTMIGPTPLTNKFHSQMTSAVEELCGEWSLVHMDAIRKELQC